MKKDKDSSPTQLKIAVAGNRRVTENVILEVRAAARQLGLEISNIEVVSQPSNGRKARKFASPPSPALPQKPASRRKPRSRA
jgi:hypothetical protein